MKAGSVRDPAAGGSSAAPGDLVEEQEPHKAPQKWGWGCRNQTRRRLLGAGTLGRGGGFAVPGGASRAFLAAWKFHFFWKFLSAQIALWLSRRSSVKRSQKTTGSPGFFRREMPIFGIGWESGWMRLLLHSCWSTLSPSHTSRCLRCWE